MDAEPEVLSLKDPFSIELSQEHPIYDPPIFSTACNPDDIEDLDALAFIADLRFYSLVDGGAAILASLNRPILNLEGGARAYPGTLRYYIHMEGDICADIFCGNYHVSHSPESR